MRIFMRVKYERMWWLNLAVLLAAAFFVCLACVSFAEGDTGLGVGFLLMVLLLFGMNSVRLFYGLHITSKNVIAFSQAGVEWIPYSEVSKITVTFWSNSVKAVIRSRGKDYEAIWSYIRLSSIGSIFDVGTWVKVNDKFIENSIAKLSQCPKVVIENRFCEDDSQQACRRKRDKK